MTTREQKEFNATRDGQLSLCHSAMSMSILLMLNRKVKQLGGESWHEMAFEGASESTLKAIQADLIATYNNLVKKQGPSINQPSQ